MDDETKDRASVGASAASAMAAAGISVINPLAGIVMAGFAPLVPYIVAKLYERQAHKGLQLVEGIETAARRPLNEALTRLAESSEGVDLLQDVLERVGSATFDEKARALGGCLGNVAVADDVETAASSERTWVRLIDQLDQPHVEALAALVDVPWDSWDETAYYQRCNSAFHEALGPYDELTKSTVIAELQSKRLAVKVPEVQVRGKRQSTISISGPFWRPESLGRQVLDRLRKNAGVTARKREQ